MRRKISLITTLIAWLFATGSHWDFVQAFAWGRMFIANEDAMTFSRALEATFDGEHPCQICQMVSQAKQKEQSSQLITKFPQKIVFIYQPSSRFVLMAPTFLFRAEVKNEMTSADLAAPPSPPPRAFV